MAKLNGWLRAGLALALTSCATRPVPAPAPLTVSASFGRTWDAVIDVFAERNIPVKTIERMSGFIATDALPVSDRRQASRWASCGSASPESVVYNVVVRGDSARATVNVTALWTRSAGRVQCSSQQVWETAVEGDVKRRAERAPGAAVARRPATGGAWRTTLLKGDPAREGYYSFLVVLPAGAREEPTWHPQDVLVTVLSGQAKVGFGRVFDEGRMTILGPGQNVTVPAKAPHYTLAVVETVLQVDGFGPLTANPVRD